MQPAGQETTDLNLAGTDSGVVPARTVRNSKEGIRSEDLTPTTGDGELAPEFTDLMEAKAAARSLGMRVFGHVRRRALMSIGTEISKFGAIKVGRGMFMLAADQIQIGIRLVQRNLRELDKAKKQNGGTESEEDRAQRIDLMKLYREFVEASSEIAKDVVGSDKAAVRASDGPPGVPSFKPGAAVTAVAAVKNEITIVNNAKS